MITVYQLIKKLGSWPVTSDAQSGVWSDSSWDLEDALNAAYLYKCFPFFTIVVGVDDKNSSSHVITVRYQLCTLFFIYCTAS